ncbi:hypothetical protein GCM10009543_22250 [Leifsonia naganoensis]
MREHTVGEALDLLAPVIAAAESLDLAAIRLRRVEQTAAQVAGQSVTDLMAKLPPARPLRATLRKV